MVLKNRLNKIEEKRRVEIYVPNSKLTIKGTNDHFLPYNLIGLPNYMRKIFSYKRIDNKIIISYKFSDAALMAATSAIKYIWTPENKKRGFPFPYFGKAIILYKQNKNNEEWIEWADIAKNILEETTKIPNCKKDHFAVLEVINKMLEDTGYLLPNELIFNIS